ncbi:MAG TPA: hypothetical protein VKV95_04440 [Terriglobia bacterium]|nr:hypothetical protein [Terriglobia bacterium]
MNVLIISIDHQVQLVQGVLAPPALNERRDNLTALLTKEIEERNVAFIGEEAHSKLKRSTIAQQMAGTHNPPIPWQNIDMTEDERKSAEIYEALCNRPFHTEKRGEVEVRIDHRVREDDIREEFMVSRAIEYAENAASILILCGDMHTRALKRKFEERGPSVDIDESLIVETNWTDAS